MIVTKTKLIVLATVWVASILSSVYITKNYVEGQAAKAKLTVVENAISDLSGKADRDFEGAVNRARIEGAAAERARLARSKGVEDAAAKADPSCDRDDESFRLLLEAIDAASGAQPTGGLLEGVRTDPKAAGQGRPSGTGVGVRSGGGFWGLPANAQGLRAVEH